MTHVPTIEPLLSAKGAPKVHATAQADYEGVARREFKHRLQEVGTDEESDDVSDDCDSESDDELEGISGAYRLEAKKKSPGMEMIYGHQISKQP